MIIVHFLLVLLFMALHGLGLWVEEMASKDWE